MIERAHVATATSHTDCAYHCATLRTGSMLESCGQRPKGRYEPLHHALLKQARPSARHQHWHANHRLGLLSNRVFITSHGRQAPGCSTRRLGRPARVQPDSPCQ